VQRGVIITERALIFYLLAFLFSFRNGMPSFFIL
jgi:hypothetical protein